MGKSIAGRENHACEGPEARGSRAGSSNLRASVTWTQRTEESRDFPFNTQYSPSK